MEPSTMTTNGWIQSIEEGISKSSEQKRNQQTQISISLFTTGTFKNVNWNITELPAGTNDVASIANDALTSASTLSVAAISVINQTVAYYLIMQKKNYSDFNLLIMKYF